METRRNTKLAVAALLLLGPAPASLYRVEDVDSRSDNNKQQMFLTFLPRT